MCEIKNKIPFLTSFTYTVGGILDVALSNLIKNYEITDYSNCDEYYFVLTFVEKNSGKTITMKAWDSNKWYAWMSEGSFIFEDGKMVMWKDCRPRRKTMNMLIKKINIFLKNKILSAN